MLAVCSTLLLHFKSTNDCSAFIKKIEKHSHKKLFYLKQNNQEVEIKITSEENLNHLEFVLPEIAISMGGVIKN